MAQFGIRFWTLGTKNDHFGTDCVCDIHIGFADSWTVLACTRNSFTSFACTHTHGKTLLVVCIM